MAREKVLTVTMKDCDMQTFRVGGAGGQHRDKTSNGVRIIHRASGARGESREERSQERNKKIAFRRMAESKEFRAWVNLQHARLSGAVDYAVKEAMRPENLHIEYGPLVD